MNENEPEVIDLDGPEETPPERPPEPKEKPKAKPVPSSDKLGKEFFAHFDDKAPHYRIAPTFHIHDISVKDADKCRLFTSWMKPKRVGLTVEWAEKMRDLKKLARLEHPQGIH